jgi:peroxiredoxin
MLQATGDEKLHPLVGEMAPDLMILRDDGVETPLSRLWQDGPAVLVFLRHSGCTFCREHVAQLQNDISRFVELQTVLGLITVGRPTDASAFCREFPASFVCLSDAEKHVYRAYGLSRGTSQELFGPHIWARGFQAALHGHFQGMPKGDPFQMPGVFIVDGTGIVRYVHRHRDAADNPPNRELFEILESL